jgi:hypothetical protein
MLFFLFLFICLIFYPCYASESSGYWELKEIKKVNNFKPHGKGCDSEVTKMEDGCIIYYTSFYGFGKETFYERKCNWTPPPHLLIPGDSISMTLEIENGKIKTFRDFYEEGCLWADFDEYGVKAGEAKNPISIGQIEISIKKSEGSVVSKTIKTDIPDAGYGGGKMQIMVVSSGGKEEFIAAYIYIYTWIEEFPER